METVIIKSTIYVGAGLVPALKNNNKKALIPLYLPLGPTQSLQGRELLGLVGSPTLSFFVSFLSISNEKSLALRSAAHEGVPRPYNPFDLSQAIGSLLDTNLVLCSIEFQSQMRGLRLYTCYIKDNSR